MSDGTYKSVNKIWATRRTVELVGLLGYYVNGRDDT